MTIINFPQSVSIARLYHYVWARVYNGVACHQFPSRGLRKDCDYSNIGIIVYLLSLLLLLPTLLPSSLFLAYGRGL